MIAYGKEVTIQVLRKDRHGRTAGDVMLTDGINVSRELVKAGLASWYRQYSKDASLGVLEADARQAKRGLWADQNPVPPWEVRQPKQGRTPLARGDLSSEPMENPETTPCRSSAIAILTSTIDPTALAIQPPRLKIARCLTVKPRRKQQGFTEQRIVPEGLPLTARRS